MKPRILLAALACALALASDVRAEQSGAGHYISSGLTGFSTAAPGVPGWASLNCFLYYDNARAGGARGLPCGGNIALDIKAETFCEAPSVFYTAFV